MADLRSDIGARAGRGTLGVLTAALMIGMVVAAGASNAEDSSPALPAGGLVMEPDPALRLLRADLRISGQGIREHHSFRNVSREPVAVLVAFPLPDISPDMSIRGIQFPSKTFPNFVDFRATVNGAPIATDIELQALTPKGADVTEALRLAGLPLRPDDPGLDALILALKPADTAPLLSAGALVRAEGSTPVANWRLRTTFYWRQMFAAGETVQIEHAYKPVTGAFPVVFDQGQPFDAPTRARHCISPAWESAARRLAAATRPARLASDQPTVLSAQTVSYALSGGREWRRARQLGPPAQFSLTLDKGAPEDLMTLCGPGGLVKTSPTTFEMRRAAFMPTRDLDILILRAR